MVLPVAGAEDARRLIAEVRPDLVLLDGDTDSARNPALLALLVAADSDDGLPLPVVLLQSAGAGEEGPLVPQLRVTKPYRPQALADAVQRILHARRVAPRSPVPTSSRLRAGALELDFESRSVQRLGAVPMRSADLAPTELRLLQSLMLQPERTHSRHELVEAVWGHDAEVAARTVDQYVCRLREALAAVGAEAALKTVRGVGYRIELHAVQGHA